MTVAIPAGLHETSPSNDIACLTGPTRHTDAKALFSRLSNPNAGIRQAAQQWLAAKPVGYFTIEPWGNRWALTAHRIGKPPETMLAATPGELNRLRMKLTDSGLTGYAPGGMR